MQWLPWVLFSILLGAMLALLLSCTKVVVNTGDGAVKDGVINIESQKEDNVKNDGKSDAKRKP